MGGGLRPASSVWAGVGEVASDQWSVAGVGACFPTLRAVMLREEWGTRWVMAGRENARVSALRTGGLEGRPAGRTGWGRGGRSR